MKRLTILKLAASAVVTAVGIGTPSVAVMANGGEQTAARPDRAVRSAERATRMMDRNRMDEAVRFAEEAVSFDPNEAAHRTLLAQSYLAVGRFASAEESFAAARALGATDSRTIIGHALTMIAAGRSADAVALVDDNMRTLPASDYGLALALAGQAERGAMILTDVVRAGGATARDRQNLALTFAFAGRWLEAQLLAAQDIGAANVEARMAQWSAMAQAGDPRMRIAGVMGTTPAEDPGMPVRLALNGHGATAAPALALRDDPAPLAMYAPAPPAGAGEMAYAAAEASPEPDYAPVAVAASDPAPVEAPAEFARAADPAPVAMAIAEPSPVAQAEMALQFVSNPIIQPLRSAVALVAPLANPTPNPAPARAARVAAVAADAAPAPATAAVARTGPVRTTGWAVQLGAYESVGVARDGWARLTRRHAALSARDAISTAAVVRGRTFYRLNATGFASRAEAMGACAALQSSGSTCFVRQLDGRDTVRWASRTTGTRLASR